ncbi:MAG: Spy/CpxP family protein refolding chaperone [Cyanobacteria bacterium J06642_2]
MYLNRRTTLVILAAAAAVSVLAPVAGAQSVPKRGGPAKLAEELDLTTEQQEQIEVIRAQQREQRATVLTAEQQTQLQAALDAGDHPRHAMRSLDLSEEQRSQLRSLHQSGRDSISAVLTEEQRQQLADKRAERQDRRHRNAF